MTALRTARALRRAGLVPVVTPARLVRGVRAGQTLGATPAATVAINAAWDPDGLAVVDDDGRLTWHELDTRVRALAHALATRHGAGPGRPVAVMCRNHRGVLEGLAAAARAGADVLALNTELTAPQITAALAGRDVAAVVGDAEFADRLPADVVLVDRERLARSAVSLDGPPGRRSRITILTSGTTGVPKAASRDLPASAMVGPITTLIEQLGLRRGEPVLVAPPLFHGFGLALMSIAGALGCPVVLQARFDARGLLELIERERVAVVVGVPVMLQRMLQADDGGHDTSSLKGVLSAGAPLSAHLATQFMDRFGDLLCNGYGSTETGFGAIAGPADLRAAPGTIGRAPLGSRLAILDADRREVAPGVTGHIFVGGKLTIDGYDGGGGKETTADGLMNTGDLGHADSAGRVFVDGREDDMIVSGGENVFPQEVEDVLSAHSAVTDAAVLGVPDDEFGQRLVAFVVADCTEDELIAHLRAHLERYKLPRSVTFVADIPRTPTGKVLRRALQD